MYIYTRICIYAYVYVDRRMGSVPLLDGWIDVCMDIGWMDGWMVLDNYEIPIG